MKKIFSTLAIMASFLLPSLAFAQENTDLGQVDDFGDLISKIWGFGFVVILALSVLMIVVGGFMYMSSSGSDDKVDQAKQIINGSLISTAIVLFSGVLQRLIAQTTDNLDKEGEAVKLTQLPDAIKNATNILLAMAGGFAVIMLIFSSYQYVTARGEAEKVDKAKKSIMYSILGLGVSVGAFLIMNTFIGFFQR